VSIEALNGVDFSAADEPELSADLREYFEGWFRYQRHEFLRKLRDLTPENMVAWSVPPVELSVLGLVRHMTQMEHVYVSWGLGGGEQAVIYGDDDYAGVRSRPLMPTYARTSPRSQRPTAPSLVASRSTQRERATVGP
jgi:hypothetical protein